MNPLEFTVNVLRGRVPYLKELMLEGDLGRPLRALFLSSVFLFFIAGCGMGAQASLLQAVASGVKLPVMYLVTMLICAPTLYFFNLYLGSKMRFKELLLVLAGTMNITSALLVSFFPVVVFFWLTINDYDSYVLMNVAFFALTGYLGVKFFAGAFQLLHRDNEGDPEKQVARRKLLRAWMLLYALVGAQMGWTLRPFFGNPDLPFEFIRERKSNFFQGVLGVTGKAFLDYDVPGRPHRVDRVLPERTIQAPPSR